MKAAGTGSKETVELLLKNGADANHRNQAVTLPS